MLTQNLGTLTLSYQTHLSCHLNSGFSLWLYKAKVFGVWENGMPTSSIVYIILYMV